MANDLNQNIIQGDDVMCWVDSSVAGFANNLTLTLSADSTEISNKDAGNGWQSNLITKRSWTASTEHMYAETVFAGEQDFASLFDAYFNGKQVKLDFAVNQNINAGTAGNRITDVVDTSNGWVQSSKNIYEGFAYVTGMELTANNGAAATYTVSFTGSGALKKK